MADIKKNELVTVDCGDCNYVDIHGHRRCNQEIMECKKIIEKVGNYSKQLNADHAYYAPKIETLAVALGNVLGYAEEYGKVLKGEGYANTFIQGKENAGRNQFY